MSEQKAPSGGWDKATELLGKAKEVASTGAKKAAEAAQAGMEKAQQTMDDMEKKVAATKASKVTAGGWDSPIEAVSYAHSDSTPASGNGVLVDPSEQIVSTIGSNYLQNFLSGGNVGKGFGLLTEKRFYYKGKNFSGTGKAAKSTTEEGVVALEDIAFTEFAHTRHIGFLVFAILLTVVGLLLLGFDEIGLIPLIASLPFYILFFVKRQTVFLVSFPGGGFAFDIRWYPIADIRDFQRQLHLMKDHIKEAQTV